MRGLVVASIMLGLPGCTRTEGARPVAAPPAEATIATVGQPMGMGMGTGGSAGGSACAYGGAPSGPPVLARALGAERRPLESPTRVAVDGRGHSFVADPLLGAVVERDAQRRLVSIRDGLAAPLAVAVGSGGDLYVAEQGDRSVTRFSADGARLGQLGQGRDEFLLPNDVAVERATGAVFVSDGLANAIKVYTKEGAFSYAFGTSGATPARLSFPSGVFVNANGEVFVADQNGDRIAIFDRGGTYKRCIGGGGGAATRKFGRLQGVVADSDGRIFVSDAFQGVVLAFDAKGSLLGTLGSLGEGEGQLRTPIGLALDPFNRLLVASANNARVELFGIEPFTDPRAIEAFVELRPRTLELRERDRTLRAEIRIPGVALDSVALETVRANGILASSVAVATREDREGDSAGNPPEPVLIASFSGRAVAATLVPRGSVVVTGDLRGGDAFEGSSALRVVPQEEDDDGRRGDDQRPNHEHRREAAR